MAITGLRFRKHAREAFITKASAVGLQFTPTTGRYVVPGELVIVGNSIIGDDGFYLAGDDGSILGT